MRWIRTVVQGTLGSNETWSFGINYVDASGGASGVDQSTLANLGTILAPRWNTWWSTAKAVFPADVTPRQLALSVLETTDGGAHVHTITPTVYQNLTATAGSSAGFSLPYEVACCVTLLTTERSRRGRGRIYLPPLATSTIASGGKFSTTSLSTAAGTIGSAVLAPAVAGGLVPVVVSQKGGTSHPITQVTVGDVPDAQRRRRKSLIETRSSLWAA